jgi:hypothetical protein
VALRLLHGPWVETLLIGFIGWLLVLDRLRLCRQYLFKYLDEDQALLWYAAREIMKGHLHEPCFYGQSYNSCIEGFLAGPLVSWLHLPYWEAVPIVTVVLGLLPFALMAWAAWWRRQWVVAALALAVPAILSTRYGMITGMPRGFVTGVAFGIIPAVLLLPARVRKERPGRAGGEVVQEEATPQGGPTVEPPRPTWTQRASEVLRARRDGPRAQRTWPKTRYFFVGFVAVVAGMLNPNSAILLVPVAVYGLLTSFPEWRFWAFGLLGVAAAAPYPWYVYNFYYVWHDDYRFYLREPVSTWSWANFHSCCLGLDDKLRDVVPRGVYETSKGLVEWLHDKVPQDVYAWATRSPAPLAILILVAAVMVVLLLRRQISALMAAASGVAITITSFAYSRMADGNTGVSFPYARMYLAVPVLVVWLMMLVNPSPPRTWTWLRWLTQGRVAKSVSPWMWRAVLVILAFWTWGIVREKDQALPGEVKTALRTSQVARQVPVAKALQVAHAIQAAADQEHATLVLITRMPDRLHERRDEGKKWNYVLPLLTTCESLLPSFERRTWRLHEESEPRHERILVLGEAMAPGPYRGTILSVDPPITLYMIKGTSVLQFCETIRCPVREFGSKAK